MDTCDEDMFDVSGDEDLQVLTPKNNPVEEYLMKQLSDVQTRVTKTRCEIEEVQDTTNRVLKSLQTRAQFGDIGISDSDSDLYTLEGEPVVKKKSRLQSHKQVLVARQYWKHILDDKWIIGVVVENTSSEDLSHPRLYADVKGEIEISGTTTFWILGRDNNPFWYKTDVIPGHREATVTVVLELPDFERSAEHEVFGVVAYRLRGEEYQTPLANVGLSAEEAVGTSCALDFAAAETCSSVLAVKSVSLEKIVGIRIEECSERGTRLLELLDEKGFVEIDDDVYLVKTPGLLVYCLVEILPIVEGEAQLRISARFVAQMNLVLRLLRDEFPDMVVKEENKAVEAAMALIKELELYRDDATAMEKQKAKIRTDLLIPD